MEKKFEQIINEGKKNGKKISEINAELKAAGATFHLDYTMTPDGPQTGWSEKEMEEGFIVVDTPDETPKGLKGWMKFRPDMAGQKKIVYDHGGKFEITWNENGNPVSAIRVD